MNEPGKCTGDDHYDPVSGEPTEHHPAGSIKLPGRLQAELRILALSGVSFVIGGMGAYGINCSFMNRSVSVE